MRIIPDFFGKKNDKEKETLQKLKQEIEKTKKEKEKLKEQLTQQEKSVNQLDKGKTKPLVNSNPNPTKTSKKTVKKTSSTKPLLKKNPIEEVYLAHQLLTFWGKEINQYYLNDQWFFSLLDIIKMIDPLESNQILDNLKNKEELKTVFQPLKIMENNQEKIIDLVSLNGFLKVLSFLQKMEKVPPGPFLSWLTQMANSPLPSPKDNQKIN